jgi:sterol desaturase/sphingolipid hydroxylase (fatty acid hydroxylase superfamily)
MLDFLSQGMNPMLAATGVAFLAFVALDACIPARVLARAPAWRLRGVISTLLYFAIALTAPTLWDAWLGAHTLLDVSGWPFWLQVAVGFLALEALIYVWHRTMHHIDPLWRHLHQTHHSAERVDIWGAFYFHPLDTFVFTFLGSLALVGCVGVSVAAAMTINVMALLCAMFQHANIRTPQWLGYLITRPESHALHHARGVHRYNYGDVPWFDMLLGTFRNPKDFPAESGFHDGASLKLWSLFIGRKLA